MKARTLFYVAAVLALVGSLATCAPAKAQTNDALRAYIVGLPEAMQREPQAIRAALKRPVATYSTNTVPRVRSANQKAMVQAVVPALATREAFRDAPDKDKFLDATIAAKLDAGGTLGEVRRIVKIQTLRMAILREGLETAGDEADGTATTVERKDGPPRWQALGLAALPTLDEIRGAQQ